MSWSSGVFTRFFGSTGWQDDKAAATKILASRHDSHDQDLATGLNVLLANLQLNSHFKVGSVSGSNTITGALTPALTAYGGSMYVVLIPAATNTGATTLNLNGLGAVAVQNIDGTACFGGELTINIPALLILNSAATAFLVVNPANARLLNHTTKSGSYTIAQVDGGTVVYYTGTGGHTFTLPSGVVTPETWVKIRNAGSATLTIAPSGILGWYNGGGSIVTGNRTLAIGGSAFANTPAGTNWDMEGTGLT